jgi:hypothetical protein
MTERRDGMRPAAALVCAVAGFLLFNFWGNATHGYIATNSLFYWWGFQWVNPDSETEHAWLVLAISLVLLRRNLGRNGPASVPENTGALIALVCGVLLHAVGYVAQQPRISILGLLIFFSFSRGESSHSPEAAGGAGPAPFQLPSWCLPSRSTPSTPSASG